MAGKFDLAVLAENPNCDFFSEKPNFLFLAGNSNFRFWREKLGFAILVGKLGFVVLAGKLGYSDGCVWTFGDKGHPFLYEAFALIAKTHPQVYLLVAGSGPWGKRYAELGEHVRVLGSLEPEELSGFYNALDVFVNPTLRPQGLDLTIIEAMQCGKPVVAPNYPSIVGTVVVDERFGYTFSPNVRSLVETLESVVRDGSRVLEMKGKDCKDYALSMFTATQMASAYERFFMCMTNERYCRYPLHIDS
uniref:Glycosyl transferase family 1 domain-containing protein n=1 Tax=Brassica oleracea TaxID=3712 RepID=A0A3P6GCB6_BRAOL|nr:unnamed protein product [Brassica oleracea]